MLKKIKLYNVKCRYYNEIIHQPILFESIFINYFIEDYTIWNKLIRKEVFLNAYEDFKNEIYKWKWNYFEDDIWNILVHRNAKSKICLDKLAYIYNSNNNSLMNKEYGLIHFQNLIFRHEMYKKIFPKKEGEKYLIAEYIFLFNKIQWNINNLLLINDNTIKTYIFNIFNFFIN